MPGGGCCASSRLSNRLPMHHGAIEDAVNCVCHVSRSGQMPLLNRHCVDLASSNQREEDNMYPPMDA